MVKQAITSNDLDLTGGRIDQRAKRTAADQLQKSVSNA
jgi:hypothetical protein